MSAYQCEDCATWWDSQAARDECMVLDAAEDRAARRPAREVTKPARYYDDEDD